MAFSSDAEQVLELAHHLNAEEKLEIAERLIAEVRSTNQSGQYDLGDLEGLAAYPMMGQDAQEWVSRTRLETNDALGMNGAIQYGICIKNDGYEADLKLRTVYQILPDESATRSNYIRVIDETGEDYLFPADYFVLIEVPLAAEQILFAA